MSRRTNEEWLELYNQQRASGQTLKNWCEEKGIKTATMADRITRLRKNGLIKGTKPPGGRYSEERAVKGSWVEVNPSKDSFCSEMKPKEDCLEIRIGECQISVYDGFNPVMLGEVCKVLVSLC